MDEERIQKTIPAFFDARAYLKELMQQLPGRAGREEICQQLANYLGRKSAYSAAYLENVGRGRQPLSEHFRLALWLHSAGKPVRISAGGIPSGSLHAPAPTDSSAT